MIASQVREEVERSADPSAAGRTLERVMRSHPDVAERIDEDAALRAAVVAVAAASPWLGRVCVTDPAAVAVLGDLARPVDLGRYAAESVGGVLGPTFTPDGSGIARGKRLELLRIAARDLLGLDGVEQVGEQLSRLAACLLQLAWDQTRETDHSEGLAVIGMGKLGGAELNYSSDVDLLLVSPPDGSGNPRHFLDLARTAWRVDLDLRPEGRSGTLSRTLASYQAYWGRWADTWEFQALLKARAVAGEPVLGSRFEEEAVARIWARPFGAEELRQVRQLKARAEQAVSRQGLADRELKRGKGGIRDIEFAIQLLQLVHGRADPGLRSPSTVPALRALAAGGYIAPEDAASLEEAYAFLRTVEHRLQLYEDEQVHTVPTGEDARMRLARVLGYRDSAPASAVVQFDADLRRHQAKVRWIHERLFFRPLLESFTAAAPAAPGLPPEAVVDRLRAFGFADADRTSQAVRELTRGFSRSSQLMAQMLPMLLDWLSHAPNPDLGLLGLRTLATGTHRRDQLTALCRESPVAARQLCQLLGTGPRFARAFEHHPDQLAGLATGDIVVHRARKDLDERATRSLAWRSGEGAVERGLRQFLQSESLRIAARDVLDLADVDDTGVALSDLAESVVNAALAVAAPPLPFAVIGMGRLGGRELAYTSDLDLLFVYEAPAGLDAAGAAELAEATASTFVRILGGTTPATGLYRVDTALRPEGRHGPQARSLEAYAAYYERWARVWERQALLRGRPIAGDPDLGLRFSRLAGAFVWDRPFGPAEVREVRRTKARIERERVPPTDDPKFHLKLGPGSLSDIEWTAQLLQLQHGVRETGTVAGLQALARVGALSEPDRRVLVEAYCFCERARNRLGLVRDGASDSLPTTGPQLTALGRSLGTTGSGLRDEYRRHTRRARRVVERLFFGDETPRR